MSAPTRTEVFPLETGSGLRSALYYRSGYLIQVSRDILSKAVPNVFLSSPIEHSKQQLTAWPKGAISVWTTWADVSSKGYVAVSGEATYEDSSTGGFVMVLDMSGHMRSLFSTGTYLPIQITQDATGHIWAVGQERQSPGKPLNLDYDVLRSYSDQGVVLQHLVPRKNVSNSLRNPWKLESQLFLRASSSLVMLYAAADNVIAVVDESNRPRINTLPQPVDDSTSRITGAAPTDDNVLLVSTTNGSDRRHASRGLFEVDLAEQVQTLSWQGILPSSSTSSDLPESKPPAFQRLIGSDGTSLVYRVDEGTRYSSLVLWSNLQ